MIQLSIKLSVSENVRNVKFTFLQYIHMYAHFTPSSEINYIHAFTQLQLCMQLRIPVFQKLVESFANLMVKTFISYNACTVKYSTVLSVHPADDLPPIMSVVVVIPCLLSAASGRDAKSFRMTRKILTSKSRDFSTIIKN